MCLISCHDVFHPDDRRSFAEEEEACNLSYRVVIWASPVQFMEEPCTQDVVECPRDVEEQSAGDMCRYSFPHCMYSFQ